MLLKLQGYRRSTVLWVQHCGQRQWVKRDGAWNLPGLISVLCLLYIAFLFAFHDVIYSCSYTTTGTTLNILTFGTVRRCQSHWSPHGKWRFRSQLWIDMLSLHAFFFIYLYITLRCHNLWERIRSHSPIKRFYVECFENDKMIDFAICSQSLGAALAQRGERKSLVCFPLHFISYFKWVCVPCLHFTRSSCCCERGCCIESQHFKGECGTQVEFLRSIKTSFNVQIASKIWNDFWKKKKLLFLLKNTKFNY